MGVTFYLCLITALSLPSIFNSIMPGGWRKCDPNDPKIQKLANVGLAMHNKQSNCIHYFRLLQVLSAESQVVKGVKYNITSEIGETDCSKNCSERNGNTQCCDPKKSNINKKFTCSYLIIEESWMNKTEVLKISCP
ncbi:cystatin-1-like [Pyxicephalus adspersus]|uniref:cystatin-1-like n=1 Tax=Pyxicephalus adspersus TaxID=30357 RepID=UPI003B5CF0F0